MQVVGAVVGRKWLGSASCVSLCGRHEIIWPMSVDESQQENCSVLVLTLSRTTTNCQTEVFAELLTMTVTADRSNATDQTFRADCSLPWYERTTRAKLVWCKRHTAWVADVCRTRTPQV
jgi:hypothetical protein